MRGRGGERERERKRERALEREREPHALALFFFDQHWSNKSTHNHRSEANMPSVWEVGLESQLMRPLARVETGLGSHPALKSLGSPSQKAFKAYALDALRCRGT